MADETKTTHAPDIPAPEQADGPPAPEPTEQAVIPGMDGGPAPSGKEAADKAAGPDIPGAGDTPPEAAASVSEYTKQEWERPLADIEAEQKKPRRGRPPKEDKTGPEAGEKKPGRGRAKAKDKGAEGKADKAPGKGKRAAPGKDGPSAPAKAGRAKKPPEKPAPAQEEAPPPEPPQPRDATRAE